MSEQANSTQEPPRPPDAGCSSVPASVPASPAVVEQWLYFDGDSPTDEMIAARLRELADD